jgi:8-oxo-dGTP diphosphatase
MKRETGRGLIIHNGKMLLMERWRDGSHYFSIPGGGIEKGETPEQATKRELHEELGVRIQIIRKLYEVHIQDSLHFIFLCAYLDGEPQLHPESPEAMEHANGKNLFKPGWVEIKSIDSIPLLYWEPIREVLSNDLKSGFSVDTKTITV